MLFIVSMLINSAKLNWNSTFWIRQLSKGTIKCDAVNGQLVIHLLPYIQSSTNPFIYSFMSQNFRSTVGSLWRRARDRCSRHGGTQRSTDWNLVELGVDGRSARNLSLANTTPVARTVSLIVWTTIDPHRLTDWLPPLTGGEMTSTSAFVHSHQQENVNRIRTLYLRKKERKNALCFHSVITNYDKFLPETLVRF